MRNLNKPEIPMAGKSRKIDRNIARARMRRVGVVHPNKPQYGVEHGLLVKRPSYFAQHWREVAKLKV